MYLIDKTYFQGKINVPNLNEYDGSDGTNSAFEISIDKYVPMFLQNVLGTVLFTELDSFIDGVDLDPLAPQKWIDLVDGVSYDDKIWRGLRYTKGLYKESVLAYFVYFNHYQETFSSGIGQVVGVGKNTITANPTQHLTDVYNTFVEMYQGTCAKPKASFNNGVLFIDYLGTNAESGYVSLLQFLMDKKDDYSTASAPSIEYKNQLGI